MSLDFLISLSGSCDFLTSLTESFILSTFGLAVCMIVGANSSSTLLSFSTDLWGASFLMGVGENGSISFFKTLTGSLAGKEGLWLCLLLPLESVGSLVVELTPPSSSAGGDTEMEELISGWVELTGEICSGCEEDL